MAQWMTHYAEINQFDGSVEFPASARIVGHISRVDDPNQGPREFVVYVMEVS